MVKKIITIVLLVIGVLGICILLAYGGPVFPHIIGPSALTVIGLGLLLYKRRAK